MAGCCAGNHKKMPGGYRALKRLLNAVDKGLSFMVNRAPFFTEFLGLLRHPFVQGFFSL